MTKQLSQFPAENFPQAGPIMPDSLRFRTRKILRDSYFFLLSQTQFRSPEKNCLRCFNSHYVFDDQTHAFEQAIKYLTNLGEFVNTDDMVDMIEGKTPVDGRYFHISFDDGLKSLLRNAAPVLDKYNVPTLVFVNSKFVAAPDEDPTQGGWTEISNYKKPIRVMTWSELRDSNFEIGAHTRSHQKLSFLDDDPQELESEVLGCKQDIETALGIKCDYFAWPFGTREAITRKGLECVERAGYRAAFGSYRDAIVPGKTPLIEIPRQHFETNWSIRHIDLVANGVLEKK